MQPTTTSTAQFNSEDPEGGTRDRIVEAAAELFWRNGYASTSLAAIAEAAKCHGGSLYHFFKTKDQLLVAVLERHHDRLGPQIVQPAFARAEDPVERVFAVLELYRQMLDTADGRFGCPVGNLAIEIADKSAAARVVIDRTFDALIDAMSESLESAGDALPDWVDRKELAKLAMTIIEGGIMLARAKDDLAPFDSSVRQLRSYFRLLRQEAAASKATSSGPSGVHS